MSPSFAAYRESLGLEGPESKELVTARRAPKVNSVNSIRGLDKVGHIQMAKKRVARTLLYLDKHAGLTTDVIIPKLYKEVDEIVESVDEGLPPDGVTKIPRRVRKKSDPIRTEINETDMGSMIAASPIELTLNSVYNV
jgi:hypothetical protein